MVRMPFAPITLVAYVAFLGFAGCGGGNEPTDASSSADDASGFDGIVACLTESGLGPEEEPVPATHGLQHEVYFSSDDLLVMRFYESAERAKAETPSTGRYSGISTTVVTGPVVINSLNSDSGAIDPNIKTARACLPS